MVFMAACHQCSGNADGVNKSKRQACGRKAGQTRLAHKTQGTAMPSVEACKALWAARLEGRHHGFVGLHAEGIARAQPLALSRVQLLAQGSPKASRQSRVVFSMSLLSNTLYLRVGAHNDGPNLFFLGG